MLPTKTTEQTVHGIAILHGLKNENNNCINKYLKGFSL